MSDRDIAFHKSVGVFALLTTMAAGLAQAQAPSDASAEASTTLDAVKVVSRGQVRASDTITAEDLKAQAPGVAPQALLNALPGVNVQQTDPYGLYEFGSTVRIRGFTGDQLATSLDGVPLETYDVRDGSPPNRYVDTENLKEITVAQGSGDVTAPSYHALGGSIRYFTDDPMGIWHTSFSATGGSQSLNRTYARIDTPALWTGGPIAYLSGSRTRAVQWDNAKADMAVDHVDAKIKQKLSNGSLTFTYRYGNRDDHDASYYDKDSKPYNDYFVLNDFATGDAEKDGLFYDNWLNGRTDQLASVIGEFALTPSLKLDVVPYYEKKTGYGVGGVAASAAQSLYDDANAGTPGRTDIAAPRGLTRRKEFLNGDRLGATAGLTWTAGIHTVQTGLWYEDYDFSQRRPLFNLTGNGEFAFNELPVAVYYDRDFSTKVTQFYLKDSVFLFSDRLGIEVGFKGLNVDRGFSGIPNSASFNASQTTSINKTDKDYFQPQVGASFKLNSSEELFGNYAENFSSIPRLALVASSYSDDLKPETSTNIDFGIRSQRGRFNGSFSLYYVDYKDRILQLQNPDPFRVGEDIYQNVGAIKTYGAELAAYWNPTKRWRLGSTLSLNNSKFQDDYVTGDTDAAGNATTRVVPVKGNVVPDTPYTMAVANATYKIAPFFFGGEAKFTGRRSSSTTGMESIEAYTVVNLNAGFKGTKGGSLEKFSTQINLYNLFDDNSPGYDEFGESGGGFYLTPPRAVYLTVRADI
ncbi:MAG: TonB-dependent receptor [Stagnimonas sp.]|nr:TonB-dependent receptor [Stagnimonas sp.]